MKVVPLCSDNISQSNEYLIWQVLHFCGSEGRKMLHNINLYYCVCEVLCIYVICAVICPYLS